MTKNKNECLLILAFALLSLDAFGEETRSADVPSRVLRDGPLAEYVAKPDASFRWMIKDTGQVGEATYAQLILTSQTWHDVVWKHQLYVIRPASLRKGRQTALLYITGGSWNDRLEEKTADNRLSGEARALVAFAERLRSPVAVLRQVPHQPIFDGKYEDAAIALTFENYLRSNDNTWPLLLPMVKSAVCGMDAVQEFTRQEWSLDVQAFTVTGASKRGWTTWLTAAVDPRVAALAPMVIDMLNMKPQLDHQQAVWGAPSYKIHDYTERGLHQVLQTEKGRALRDIVDPFQYRRHLTQPKLILLGTNDHYWPVDALNLYWNDLAGEKSILYVPNNGHGLQDYGRLFGSLSALHQHAATGAKLPKLHWRFQAKQGAVCLTVQSEPAADEVVAWVAAAGKRDFREATWKSYPTTIEDGRATYEVETPKHGFAAVFAEAKYSGTEMPSDFSTNVRVLEAESR